jgi:ankyrin repeat protein
MAQPSITVRALCVACLLLQTMVSVLLAAGANPNASDALAGCCLLAAVRKGHDAVISQLVSAGAKLQLPAGELSCALCSAVAAGDGQLLRRYIAAGADASVCDYNGQTPLHVAASHGKMDLVSVVPCPVGLFSNCQPIWYGVVPCSLALSVCSAMSVDCARQRVGGVKA